MKYVLRALLTASGWLPLPLLHGAGTLLGLALWLFPSGLKHRTQLHLALAFPGLGARERARIALASFIESAKATVEAPAIWFGPEFRLRRWLRDASAQEAFAEQLKHGAAIALCPHLGAWELAGMFCAAHAGITSLYKPQKGAIDALILEGRQRLGARLVPTDGTGVRALLQTLKDGKLIGILPDHDPPEGSGEFAPLFGEAAHTTPLVGKLAARAHAPVFFCIAQRKSFGRGFRFHIVPVAVAARDVEALNRAVEDVIRRWPEQYWWSYARYRRRPPGAAPLYG